MINLLDKETKGSLRLARTNAILVDYCMALAALAVLIGLVYAAGFWIIRQEKDAMETGAASQQAELEKYKEVSAQAANFRQNLAVAKRILDKEISYSAFLTTLAKDLPQGSIIDEFQISAQTVSVPAAATAPRLPLAAKATNYETALLIKSSLEESELFEDVRIDNIDRPDDISKLTGLDAKYPYTVKLSLKLSAQKIGAN